MNDNSLKNKMVEIIKDKLYWISDEKPPKGLKNAMFFSIDSEIKYIPYFSDFGPLSIG